MHATDFHDQFAEWQHRTRLSAAWAGGHAMRFVTGTSVLQLFTAGASTKSYLLGSAGIGLSIGVRVYMVNQEHGQQIKRLTSLYRDEIASYLGVDPAAVGEEELRKAAESIPALDDALERNDKRRTSKLAAWIGGGVLAGILLIQVVAPLALLYLPVVLTTGLGGTLAGMAATTALFSATKEAVEFVSKNVLHITEPTAHDHIQDMVRELRQKDPHPITQDQVFEAILAANTSMADQLTQAMGKPFNKLDAVTRSSVLKQYSEILHLDQLAEDINNHQIRPQELMFIAIGKQSGVERLPERPLTNSELMEQRLHQEWERSREKAGHALEEGKHRAQAFQAHASERVHHAREAMHQDGVKAGWRALVSKDHSVRDPNKSWAEHVQGQPGAEITR